MRVEHISSTKFTARPQLKVSKENRSLFNEVANVFHEYTKILEHKSGNTKQYEIVQNKKGLTFTEYEDGFEHSIRFGKKLTEEFLEKPADYIAQTFAKAAEVFALDDRLWFKTLKFTNDIANDVQLKMPQKRQGKYEDCILCEVYDKYILKTLKEHLKENGFLSRAKINI